MWNLYWNQNSGVAICFHFAQPLSTESSCYVAQRIVSAHLKQGFMERSLVCTTNASAMSIIFHKSIHSPSIRFAFMLNTNWLPRKMLRLSSQKSLYCYFVLSTWIFILIAGKQPFNTFCHLILYKSIVAIFVSSHSMPSKECTDILARPEHNHL